MDNSFNDSNDREDLNHSFIRPEASIQEDEADDHRAANEDFSSRFWIESKKLWHIVGPAIFSRIVSFSMNVITVAFGGHLGDVEFAAISISLNVIAGFNFGFMVLIKLYVL